MRTVEHDVESDISSSRICTRVFIHIGLEFTSDMGYLLFEVCIFNPGDFLVNAKENQQWERN